MRKAVLHLKKADPVLEQIIQRAGPCRIEFRDPTFETLVRSIVFQQLNGKAASTIYGRLAEKVAVDPITPAAILTLTLPKMRKVGLSKQKASYIRDLAKKTKSGEIDFAALPALSDEAVIEHLTRVKGIGVWTAHMFLIFALRRPNVLPTGDYGIRAGARKAYGLGELPKAADLEKLAEKWHPHCSVASWYLWRCLESE